MANSMVKGGLQYLIFSQSPILLNSFAKLYNIAF